MRNNTLKILGECAKRSYNDTAALPPIDPESVAAIERFVLMTISSCATRSCKLAAEDNSALYDIEAEAELTAEKKLRQLAELFEMLSSIILDTVTGIIENKDVLVSDILLRVCNTHGALAGNK